MCRLLWSKRSSLKTERCCCCSWCLLKALICWTWFCCPGAVWVADQHAVVLWHPVVPQKPCHPVRRFVWRADQRLLHHGRQHGRVEAEASGPGIEKHAAERSGWEEEKAWAWGNLWGVLQLHAHRSTNPVQKNEAAWLIRDGVSEFPHPFLFCQSFRPRLGTWIRLVQDSPSHPCSSPSRLPHRALFCP